MATGTTVITIQHPNDDITFNPADKSQTLAVVEAHLGGFGSGATRWAGSAVEVRQPATATGTLTLSGASGTVGGTINGVAVTVAASGGDAATATALAAAINASAQALVSEHVTARASGAVVTLTAKTPGAAGNAVTLAASGTGVTASGARLTGGTVGAGGPLTF